MAELTPSIVVPGSTLSSSLSVCSQLVAKVRAFLNSSSITKKHFSGGEIKLGYCPRVGYYVFSCPVMFRSTKVGYINVGLLVETEHINLTYRRTEDLPSCNIGEDVFTKVHLMFGVYQKLSNIIQAKVDQAGK